MVMVKRNLFATFSLAPLTVLNFTHASYSRSLEKVTASFASLQEDDNAFHGRKLDPFFRSSSNLQITVSTIKERSHSPRHSVNLYVGTPPQIMTVRIDTGSRLTAFRCAKSFCDDFSNNCRYKNDLKDIFISEHSTTFHKLNCTECRIGRRKKGNQNDKCNINNTIAEHQACNVSVTMMENREISSWTGYETEDVAYFAGTKEDMISSDVEFIDMSLSERDSFDLKFDCQTSEVAATSLESGGIMSMSNTEDSIWSKMHRSGVISQRAFSICLGAGEKSGIESENSGTLTFGGVDSRLSSFSSMIFAKNIQSSSGVFKVWVNNMYLRDPSSNGQGNSNASTIRVDIDQEDLNGDGIILDSGRMESYFTQKLEDPFLVAWKQMTGKTYDNNPISDLDLSSLPTILFDLQVAHPVESTGLSEQDHFNFIYSSPESSSLIVEMPPSHYMQRIVGTEKYKPQFYVKYSESESSVLGANFMQGHNILFDVENQRIGFSISNCTIPLLPTGPGQTKPGQNRGENDQMPQENLYCTSTRCRLEMLTGLWLALTIACLSWTCCDSNEEVDMTNNYSRGNRGNNQEDESDDDNKQCTAQLV